MIKMAARSLQEFIYDYEYEITITQAEKVLKLLDDTLGVFSVVDLQMATDFIVYGKDSIYAEYFE